VVGEARARLWGVHTTDDGGRSIRLLDTALRDGPPDGNQPLRRGGPSFRVSMTWPTPETTDRKRVHAAERHLRFDVVPVGPQAGVMD
jgi:hypothetical protein